MSKEETKVDEITKPDEVETADKAEETTKTLDEIKAEAEALEKENKELKKQRESEEEYQNQQRRLEKAREKNESLKQTTARTEKGDDLDVRDILALDKAQIPEDSEKAELLKKYKDAGLIKSFAEGMSDEGIIAKFKSIDERNNVKTVIDENNQEEYQRTKKEIIDGYRRTGETPNDPATQKLIADENLKEMGL